MTTPHPTSGFATTPLLGTVDAGAGAVRLQRTLAAPPEQVWAALTDPQRLSAWLAPVQRGRPGPDATFVLAMTADETATCTVVTWDPPHELGLVWDYTGEGPSQLRIQLRAAAGRTQLTLQHDRIPVDPVQYGAGWHVYLEVLAAHLTGEASFAPDGGLDFMAAYHTVAPRYAAAAVGGTTG